MLGIKGIQVKVIDCDHTRVDELNSFLREYDGFIIDIKTVEMLYGRTRYVVIYKEFEDE